MFEELQSNLTRN